MEAPKRSGGSQRTARKLERGSAKETGRQREEEIMKLGFTLLIAQIAILAMTLGFNAVLDHKAQQDGIAAIIQEAR